MNEQQVYAEDKGRERGEKKHEEKPEEAAGVIWTDNRLRHRSRITCQRHTT